MSSAKSHKYYDNNFSDGDRPRKAGLTNLNYRHDIMASQTSADLPPKFKCKQKYITVGILTFTNLLNYIDRFTVAGVLEDVKHFFSVGNANGGLIQTAFIIAFTLMAPVFGYIGDRHNRMYMAAFGVGFWSLMVLLSSFVPPHMFGVFLLLRALVGVGEASFSTVAPTIIGDLFSKNMRSRMLALFYFAIPVGSGLGYIVGFQITQLSDGWEWSQRITPILGAVSVFLILLLVKDPHRGESDGITDVEVTNLKDDIKYLYSIKSYVFATLAFTGVAFSAGAIAWFGPDYMRLASQRSTASTGESNIIFGAISCVAGITGVVVGCMSSQYFRRFYGKSDPLVCSTGVLLSIPLVYVALVTADHLPSLAWTATFFAQVCLSVNWVIIADISLSVIMPTRRALGQAIQLLVAHGLGDAISPYIVGQVADVIATATEDGLDVYYSLQYGLFIPTSVLVLAALFFFLSSLHIEKDKANCSVLTHGLCAVLRPWDKINTVLQARRHRKNIHSLTYFSCDYFVYTAFYNVM